MHTDHGIKVTLPSVALLTLRSSASLNSEYLRTLLEVVESWPLSHPLQPSLTFFCSSADAAFHQKPRRYPVMWTPFERTRGLEMVRGLASKTPQRWAVDPGFRLVMRVSVMGPPPSASKKTLNPCSLMSSLYWFSHSPLVIRTCLAPSDLRRSACSSLLTMFSRGIPRSRHLLLSILPSADAAPVWMIPFFPGLFSKIEVIPTTVRGLTTPEAAQCRGTSSSISKAKSGSTVVNSPHDPLTQMQLILLPTQCWTASPLASTTLPVPSRPIVAGSWTGKQQPPMRSLSEGLMVEPSTLTSK